MHRNTLYRIPKTPYLRLRFQTVAGQRCHLPAQKGSLLRGAFGHALRRTVCVMGPKQECQPCLLRTQCIYSRLFETFVEELAPRFLRGLKTAPRPYVFEPFDTTTEYAPGESLQFDFILMGQVVELYPYAIYAVDRMAKAGLGAKRHPFTLQQVMWQKNDAGTNSLPATDENGWERLYDGASQRLLAEPKPRTAPDNTRVNHNGSLQLEFLTPTRLKFKNELTIEFSFRMLVFKMLRRVLELAHFHVPDAELNWEFHDLLVAADRVRVVRRHLYWVDWQRHSNRQHTTMKMGGLMGLLNLEGPVEPFMDLLRTSAVVHVGKGAVFGNGKVGVANSSC